MKKRGKSKPHKENVYLFPNVDKLLMKKGLDKLQNKRFTEAIEFLEKALELDEENEEILLGLIIAYFESGNLIAAKTRAHESLQKGFGDYFQLIDLYIMILLQLNEYEEIVQTIQALLDEKEIPIEKLSNFTKILEFSKRKIESEYTMINHQVLEEEQNFNLLQYSSLNDQFLAVAELAHTNVRIYLNGIKQYLKAEEGHPFIKTMLLQLLKEQEVNEEIVLEKFQQTLTINPLHLLELEVYIESTNIMEVLRSEIEQGNPTLYESIKGVMNRHSFLLFPVERDPSNPLVWAAAYHFLALEYFGNTSSSLHLATKYKVNQGEVTEAISFIKELEEISSPQI